MTFPTRLRALRLERGWSQGQLAARASMYTSMVCDYERGKHMPRGKVLAQLAAALGVSRETLTGDSEVKQGDET